jgi:hypothetical protein
MALRNTNNLNLTTSRGKPGFFTSDKFIIDKTTFKFYNNSNINVRFIMARTKKVKTEVPEVSKTELKVDDLKNSLLTYKNRNLTSDELLTILNINKEQLEDVVETLSSRQLSVLKKTYYFEEHEGADLALIPSYIINNYFTNGHFYHPITKNHISSNNIDKHIIRQFEVLDFK